MVYTYHSWCQKSSRLHSGIKNVLQDSLEDAPETQWRMSSSSAPRDLEFFTELPSHLYISILRSKVSILHLGIKNVLQDSLEDGLEMPRRMFYSNAPRDMKFCAELPKSLYMSFLTFIVISPLYSIQESRISSKNPSRMLWKLKGECPLPVHLEVWNFEQSFLNIYMCPPRFLGGRKDFD